MILDEAADAQQRDALSNIVGGKAGGLFGMLGPMVKQNLGASFARFTYSNDENTWSVRAGSNYEVSGSFVKPPPHARREQAPARPDHGQGGGHLR